MWRGVIDRYRERLPVAADERPVSLAEGNTPLLPADRLLERAGVRLSAGLLLKFEGANPTGSFKDRGMTVAVTRARTAGARMVICASTGNTSASAAAYAARAGLVAAVLVPEGAVAAGKLAQARVCGAELVPLAGNFDRALAAVRRLAERNRELALVNSLNPDRIEGQKTVAFEIAEQLAGMGHPPPGAVALPVGNAGNITACWRGFTELSDAGELAPLPRMVGVQAEGAAPLVRGEPVEHPETVATAIRIGRPASREGALRAVRDSGGRFEIVSDREILDAQRLVAESTGLFCEPASAAPVAGVVRLAREGRSLTDGRAGPVVCVLTGHGLKDPDALTPAQAPPALADEVTALEERLLGAL